MNRDEYFVKQVKHTDCKEFFLEKHYAKRMPPTGIYFGLYNEGLFVGALCFSPAANKNLNNISGFPCLELSRLVIDEGHPKNTLSYFVSKSLAELKKPLVLVSYADTEQNHIGFIYQATNWIYTGLSTAQCYYEKDGVKWHRKTAARKGINTIEQGKSAGYEYKKGKGKHRYFYFIANKNTKKEMLKNFKYKVQPYPKVNE